MSVVVQDLQIAVFERTTLYLKASGKKDFLAFLKKKKFQQQNYTFFGVISVRNMVSCEVLACSDHYPPLVESLMGDIGQ